ncbi:septum formation protein Maf [Candidatus Vecturithrix granuli]|uniref:dTTP/UTP pyrophosphatase n=1 Tax=Vecturithrix granuli TaxID=1499967 RepID=A0A081C6K7_VECG1|nr:septum formation protein Maf [Candidatus Vecturithrix granuli]
MDSVVPRIVLASSSPRRKMLLHQLDIPFDIRVSEIDETIQGDIPAEEFARRLAFEKAEAIARSLTDTIVIGADTIVVDERGILGKPQHEQEAFQMLQRLSGKVHRVITGVAVISTYLPQNALVNHETTQVKIAALSDRDIQCYIHTGEPLDKAGAYAIQGKGAMFVEWIHGCYNNVVGLPLFLLIRMLKNITHSTNMSCGHLLS